MSSKVQFQTNIPVEVALAYDGGKQVEGNYGPQVMYSLSQAPNGETTMYVPPIVANRLAELKVTRGQPVQICKAEVQTGTRKSIQWKVVRVDPVKEPTGSADSQVAKPEEPAAPAATPSPRGVQGQSTIPPLKMQFDAAFEEFLVLAGRSTHRAESRLGTEGVSVRLDNRDTAAIATTMFIEAARRGYVIWTPEAYRDAA